jgi:hypothetical protein
MLVTSDSSELCFRAANPVALRLCGRLTFRSYRGLGNSWGSRNTRRVQHFSDFEARASEVVDAHHDNWDAAFDSWVYPDSRK